MSGELDDYGNLLSTSLANTNTNTNSLFGDGYTIALPGAGSNATTAAADNSGNTLAINNNGIFGSTNTTAAADNSGNTAALTAADTSGFKPITGLDQLKKFVTDNKELFALGGAGLSLLNSSPGQKTGYQGGIPNLTATRNMLAAPPPTGYRPGQGGINYGGDVTYTRTPDVDPWSRLSGTSSYAGFGGSNDASLTALLKAFQGVDGGSNLSALNTTAVTGGNALSTLNNQNAAAKAASDAAAKAAAKVASDAAAKAASDAAIQVAAAKTASKVASDAAAKAAADLAAALASGNAAAIAAAKVAADKAAADKIVADAAAKVVADKIAADKAAAKVAADKAAAKVAADKVAADKVAADKIAADKIVADKIAADKIAADAAAAKAAADKAAADKIAADKAATTKTTTGTQSAGLAYALSHNMTADQYYKNIFDYYKANSGLSDSMLKSEMLRVGVSAEDLAKATGGDLKTITSRFDKAVAKTPAEIAAEEKSRSDLATRTAQDTANKTAAEKAAADAAKAKAGSEGYQAAIKAGLTPDQYLSNINQWVEDNSEATAKQIQDAMKEFGVSKIDLNNALTKSDFSEATKTALTTDLGLQGLNQNIQQWVRDNPYATNQQIQKAMTGSGTSDENISNALSFLSASTAKENAIVNDLGLDKLYQNILDYQAAGHTPAEVAAAMAATGVDQRDINAATKFATDTGYTGNATSAAATQDFLNAGATNNAATNNAVVNNVATNSVVDNTAADKAAEVAAIIAGTDTGGTKAAESTGLNTSNSLYQYFSDPATQAALAAGDTRGIAETMQSLGWSAQDVASATGTNAADVQAAYDAALDTRQPETYYEQGYAGGGMAKGRYLQGQTDGMADELPAQIGQNQPAALSHGEFVIPADVVSHMGNGNSDAGAKKLYQMMDKIRMARTGNKKQGKKINPDKFMPGGLASAYAAGGSVKHFLEGGATLPSGTIGTESNLSNWAGPYVTNMLGQGQALANMPYQPYMGQLTAGTSPIQSAAFTNATNLSTPTSIGDAATAAGNIATTAGALTYSPTTFTNQFTSPTAYAPTTATFDTAQATAYMNPYLEASLKPQLAEARRQSEMTQQQNAAKMTQAGGYGGSRQAILDAENQRSLVANLANITGQGYNTAYTNAASQFNADQARKMQDAQFGAQQGLGSAQAKAQYGMAGLQAGEQSKQFGSTYGLQGLQTGLQAAQTQGTIGSQENQAGLANLAQQLAAGAQERGIEYEGIAADKAAFEEARANPYKMVQYQQSLLQGLPLAAQSYQGIEPSALMKASQGATTVNALLKNLGLIS